MMRPLICLSLTGFLGALNAYPVSGQEVDIKAATEGRCDYWLPMLQANPSETVHMTLGLSDQAEIKVLVDGDSWRMVLLAKADEPMGCVLAEDEGVLFRDGVAP